MGGDSVIWERFWWSRTWIYQESTVPEDFNLTPKGKRVRFLCSDQNFNWPEIAATMIVSGIIQRTTGLASPLYLNCSHQYLKLQMFRERRNILTDTSFLEILQLFRHTQCHDLRDKVYAPLCLAHESVRRNVIPDYATKTVLDTYLNVVRYCLTRPGHQLDFLAYARYEEDSQAVRTPDGTYSCIPSWVPNFAIHQNIWPIPKLMYFSEDSTPVQAYRTLSNVSATITIRNNQQHHLRGIEIDAVKDLVPKHGSGESIMASILKSWATDMNATYPTGGSFYDALATTMALDVLYDDYARACGRGRKVDQDFLDTSPAELGNEDRQRQSQMMLAQRVAWNLRSYLLMVPDLATVGDLI